MSIFQIPGKKFSYKFGDIPYAHPAFYNSHYYPYKAHVHNSATPLNRQ